MTGPRFSIIPAGAVLDPRLRARDLQVLCLFGRHTDRNGWCRRSQVKMAREMDCARSTVQASIERLVEAGWLQRRMTSIPHEPGERDSAHEYRVVLDVGDEAQETVCTLPTDRHPLPTHESAPPADSGPAPINDQSLTDPLLTGARERAGGGDFNILWLEWPDLHRPDNQDAARTEFGKLSAEHQRLAVEHARSWRHLQALRKKPANMFPYLKKRQFLELVDAPPFDKDGDFVITPQRPEWSAWLGEIRSKFGEAGVESSLKIGRVVSPRRWPENQAA